MSTISKRLLFTNIFESGIVDVWFKGVSYALATSAFLYLYFNSSTAALPFAIISYLFTGLQVVHGSRKPYEYLKKIYVYPTSNWFVTNLFYLLFFYVRLQIIISPIQIILLTYESGKLPL